MAWLGLTNIFRVASRAKTDFPAWLWPYIIRVPSDLKSASIEAHNICKEAGRPSQGDIHRLMRQAKLAYKNAIRAADTDADLAISNDCMNT